MTPDQKIDKIYDMVFDMKTEVAKSIVHQETHAEKLAEHSVEIKTLNEYKNKAVGKNAVISVVSGGVFGAIMAWVGKHF